MTICLAIWARLLVSKTARESLFTNPPKLTVAFSTIAMLSSPAGPVPALVALCRRSYYQSAWPHACLTLLSSPTLHSQALPGQTRDANVAVADVSLFPIAPSSERAVMSISDRLHLHGHHVLFRPVRASCAESMPVRATLQGTCT